MSKNTVVLIINFAYISMVFLKKSLTLQLGHKQRSSMIIILNYMLRWIPAVFEDISLKILDPMPR